MFGCLLLFAHAKLIPGKQIIVFLTGHRHLFFLIEFSSNLKYSCRLLVNDRLTRVGCRFGRITEMNISTSEGSPDC